METFCVSLVSYCIFAHEIMEKEILEKASELFLTLGFKSVTMDDIANELSISKKTLYKHYSNKQSLVKETTNKVHESCLEAICLITDQGYSSIKENLEIKKMFRELFKNVGTSPLFQLKKYYPKICDKVTRVQKIAFSECIRNNIKKGVAEGFYRNDLNIDVCVDFYLSLVYSIHEKEVPHADFLVLEHEALIYHIRAIATPEGIKELENQLKN